MAQIKYPQFATHINSFDPLNLPQLFLIFGESYLVTRILKELSAFLLGNESKEFAMETMEGGSVRMGDIIEQVSTFSFLVPKKIILVKHAPLFSAGQKNIDIPFSAADIDHFAEVIEKGFAENHFLVITTAAVDKRKKIFKTIERNGLIIDCAVSLGVRKADRNEQRQVLQHVTNQILAKSKKSIHGQALQQLLDLTGFNLDLLSHNLEKLVSYSGARQTIEPADIKEVVKRDKKDPIFNLTNAFLDKNAKQAIVYLSSLLDEGYHPLQILKSFENQIRKLLLVKCAAKSLLQPLKIKLKTMNFNSFKQTILPKIVQHDLITKAAIENQETQCAVNPADVKKKKPKKNLQNDLFLAPNPKNAYPVYQIFQKSENFTINELQSSLIFLSDLDYRLKSSSFDSITVIEHFIISTCSKGGFVYATENKNRRHRF
ncbi:MAG: DNA polymerase III subunit delta [Desulfobacula sp.]|nr:DNA polymerase III subunit delta [Desulfobacula sp.]